jgi:tetratricopeptide (TPR) repeat protein
MSLNYAHYAAFGAVALFVGGVVAAGRHNAEQRALAAPQKPASIVPMAWPRDELVTPRQKPSPPVSLTASDGTGLKLLKLDARAVLSDPLAFTELHLTFLNPRQQTIEGNFSITLPPGATVSRFAMKVGDVWQEGEMVERQAARRAYEDFLHRKQDPALLEQAAGNQFQARVFPIPAAGVKELIVAFAQELAGHADYALPLRGMPEIAQLDVALSLAGSGAVARQLHQERVVPTEDFTYEAAALRPTQGLRSGELVLARVHPVIEDAPDPMTSAVVLFDTSASRALGFDDQLELLGSFARELALRGGPQAQLTVACFDQAVTEVFSGNASEFGAPSLERIRQRGALGASNLGAALAWAGPQAKARGLRRVVFMTDGVPTAGETEADKLAAVAADLRSAGVARLDALAVGGLRDEALLRRLVTSGLPRDGAVLEGRLSPASIARRLGTATRSHIAVTVPGATWSFPTQLDGVQSGDEVFVYAQVPEGLPVSVSAGGAPLKLDLESVDRPLLERAFTQAKIASLLDAERHGAPASTKAAIVDLSLRYRVMSPYTSLLVLETNADYARFKIDRNALADLLVVDGGRLIAQKRASSRDFVLPPKGEALDRARGRSDVQRSASAAAPDDPTSARGNAWGDALGDAFGAGGLGLSGAGEGGGGAAGEEPEIGLGSLGALTAGGVSGRQAAPAAAATSGSAQGFGSGHGHGRLGGLPSRLRDPFSETDEQPADVSEKPRGADPYEGTFKTAMALLASHDAAGALAVAQAWNVRAPGDVLALVALGEAREALGDGQGAARAYGSLIDLFPGRADLRRFAGARLERVREAGAVDLALDTFEKAAIERPDHPESHRLLAFAWLRKGNYEKAFAAATLGAQKQYPAGRFRGAARILSEDLGLIAAAWTKAEPARSAEIDAMLRLAGGHLENTPSLRFVLNWETDANDVDFHIFDDQGGHAFYARPALPSGGELYADVTTGYGPECFTIRNAPAKRPRRYTLQANYYSRGPMGYGMGKLEIIEHDGRGGLTFEERPFVVQTDGAFVDLGSVTR